MMRFGIDGARQKVMLGRLMKSIVVIGAITVLSSERDAASDAASLFAQARHATLAQAQSICVADPARCVDALKVLAAVQSPSLPSRDTLTATDRAAQPRRQGG